MVRCAVSRKELSPQPGELILLVGGLRWNSFLGSLLSAHRLGSCVCWSGAFGGPRASEHFLGFGGNCWEASREGLQRYGTAHTRLRAAVPLCKGAPVITMHVHNDACVCKVVAHQSAQHYASVWRCAQG